MTSPFDALLAYQRQSEALGRIAQRLGWDHETVMPRVLGMIDREMAALEGVMHARGSGAELAICCLRLIAISWLAPNGACSI